MAAIAGAILAEAPAWQFALAGFSMGGFVAFEIMRQERAIIGRPDSRPDLPGYKWATLVRCGREDAATPLSGHEEMARLIPDARLCVIEHCGHLSTLERPAESTAALREGLGET